MTQATTKTIYIAAILPSQLIGGVSGFEWNFHYHHAKDAYDHFMRGIEMDEKEEHAVILVARELSPEEAQLTNEQITEVLDQDFDTLFELDPSKFITHHFGSKFYEVPA